MVLNVKNVDTFYGKSHILQQLSFGVEENEIIALLGRNGVGKSTTLKSIVGIVSPNNGSIKFKGEEIIGKEPFEIARKGIGYIPEERRIFPGLTVRENLIMGEKKRSIKLAPPKWNIERVYATLPELQKRDRTLAGHLSGGEQQLLSIVRTLILNPDLLLIDEPSEGLSPLMGKTIFKMLSQIRHEGITIVLVDQNLVFACRLADRVYIMIKGAIVYSSLAKKFLEDSVIQEKYLSV